MTPLTCTLRTGCHPALLAALLIAIVSALPGCGGDATPDAGTTPGDVPVSLDTPADDTPVVDTGAPDVTSAVPSYGICTGNNDCNNTGAVCLTAGVNGYPGGMCSRSCTAATEASACGTHGVCLPFGTVHRCLQACDTTADCRAGYHCVLAAGDPAQGNVNACLPFCTADAQCPGVGCNTYSRFCGAVNAMLADNGGTCHMASDCRSGRCFTELDTAGNPTGNLDGLCYSRCTIAPDSAYAGTTLPQSDCPAHNVCPQDGTTPAGGGGLCRLACTTAADCRAGYICVHPTRPGTGAGEYTNGYCAAMNCHYMTQTCPAGATCQTTRTDDAGVPTGGVCVRGGDGGMVTDGGTVPDVSTDASLGGGTDVVTDGGAGTDVPGTPG